MLRPVSLLTFFGGLALGTWLLWRAQQQRRPLTQAGQVIDPGQLMEVT
jgi:hypothetical protein